MKRFVIGTVSLAIFLSVLVALWVFRANTGTVILENRALEVVAHAFVEVCGQHLSFDSIPPGENRTATFALGGDSHYDVTVQFASGRKLNAQVGYATSGADYTERIIIKPDAIVLEGE
jgi:hypothetical protein